MSWITKSSDGGAANRSIAASSSTSATSPSAPRPSSVSTRTPVAGTPHPSSRPSRNKWSTAARMSGMASSRSPRRALSRAEYTLTIGKSPRRYSRRRNTSLTSASSVCPRSRSAAVWRCTSATPSVLQVTVNAKSSPDRAAIHRASAISRTAESSSPQQATRYCECVYEGEDRGVRIGSALRGMARPAAGRLAIQDDPGNNGP